ncbi:hypothetical protein RCG17_28170 [Neobacillus sp. PS3-12]|uniref:hypothetical protein n=1 Tax=Neobacillus sp. PS3-12 TaxID=3070677 RepID=UPI0027DF3D44|nr:hypothetical protein [Neobacillus sp. PS3-12]WML53159.1 hypothetical protein RCG17_28170 [Neobacillus sp. PS3-12]
MKSNNNRQNNKVSDIEQNLQNNQQRDESVAAQKDGLRYDYNDSSDFKDNKMS